MLEELDRIYHSCSTTYYADRRYDEMAFAGRLSALTKLSEEFPHLRHRLRGGGILPRV